jgi:phosphoglycolate phosphatase
MIPPNGGADRFEAEAVLFDLDGTLLDTLTDLANAVNQALSDGGFPTHPVDAYRLMIGDGAPVLMARALPASARCPQTIRRCLQAFERHYAAHFTDNSRPYQGVAGLLEALRSRGLTTAVLSNKPHVMTVRCTQTLLNGHGFAAVLGMREGVAGKPDPAGALEAAALAGIAPQRFVYLGDSPVDMQTAKAAGMFAVGALWGFRSQAQLLAAGAEALVQQPLELLKILDKHQIHARR